MTRAATLRRSAGHGGVACPTTFTNEKISPTGYEYTETPSDRWRALQTGGAAIITFLAVQKLQGLLWGELGGSTNWPLPEGERCGMELTRLHLRTKWNSIEESLTVRRCQQDSHNV